MLHKKKVDEIIDLIEQGKTDYQIWKETGHAVNTIAKIREKYKISEEKQTQGKEVVIKSPIDSIRKVIEDLENIIQTKQLEDREEKKIKKLVEPIREIIKMEVDDRIPKIREEAVQINNQQWTEVLEQSYVKKEVATNLEKMIQERDAIIQNLMKKNEEKDKEGEEIQSAYSSLTSTTQGLEKQNHDLAKEVQKLEKEVLRLQNYIENQLEKTVGRNLEDLKNERDMLIVKKTFIETNLENQRLDLNVKSSEEEQKQKALDMREKQLIEWKEKLQKWEEEFNRYKNQMSQLIQESATALDNRVTNVVLLVKTFQEWFDKQIEEINQEKKKIRDQQEQILRERESIQKQQTNKE